MLANLVFCVPDALANRVFCVPDALANRSGPTDGERRAPHIVARQRVGIIWLAVMVANPWADPWLYLSY